MKINFLNSYIYHRSFSYVIIISISRSEVNQMGLTVREILKASTFSDYELLAGREGLDKQVQGVAIQDAPDALKWTKGGSLL